MRNYDNTNKIYTMQDMRLYTIRMKFIQYEWEIMQYKIKVSKITNKKLYNTNENYTIQIGKYTI